MAVAGSPPNASRHEPTYFEHPLDDTEHYHHFRPRPRPGPPGAILGVVIVLLVVLVVAFLYSIRGGFHGIGPYSNGPVTILAGGTEWDLSGQGWMVTSFSATANGTLYGNFTSSGQQTAVLLLNSSQMDNFSGNISNAELYSTGPVKVGGMEWGIGLAGEYFLVGWNQATDPVILTWVTSVQYVG